MYDESIHYACYSWKLQNMVKFYILTIIGFQLYCVLLFQHLNLFFNFTLQVISLNVVMIKNT